MRGTIWTWAWNSHTLLFTKLAAAQQSICDGMWGRGWLRKTSSQGKGKRGCVLSYLYHNPGICRPPHGRGRKRLSAHTSGHRHVSHRAGHCVPEGDTALHHLFVQQNSLGEEVICLENLHWWTREKSESPVSKQQSQAFLSHPQSSNHTALPGSEWPCLLPPGHEIRPLADPVTQSVNLSASFSSWRRNQIFALSWSVLPNVTANTWNTVLSNEELNL